MKTDLCATLGALFVATLIPLAAAAPESHTMNEPAVEAFRKGDCSSCHQVPGLPAAGRLESCSECHAWIRRIATVPEARTKAMEIFPHWERYERNVASYLAVPDLSAAMARLDPQWVTSWLADPHDLRPGMPETMPRLGLSDDDLTHIALAFSDVQVDVPATPSPESTNVERGALLFQEKGCAACHTFGSLQTGPGLPTAPDLGHARARMSDDMIAAWIRNPSAIATTATMPTPDLTPDEVNAIRDYLVLTDPEWKTPAAMGPEPQAANRPVTWSEIEERITGKICVHCHMDPAQNEGRAGPGNRGGFGFPATGIELQTYRGVSSAADDIKSAMLRRRQEVQRDWIHPGEGPIKLDRPKHPGMPLGLPPIPDEDIALFMAWMEQGMPH